MCGSRRRGPRPSRYVALADLGVDEAAHAGEPCHAVVVADRYDGPQVVCTERRRHARAGASEVKPTRRDDNGRVADRERAKQRKAAAARGEFVVERLSRRLAKGPAITFVIRTLVDQANAKNEAAGAGEDLSVEADASPCGPAWAPALRRMDERSDSDALRVAVAVAVAMAEARIAALSTLPELGHDYLSFLVELGYELVDAERCALVEYDRRHSADAVEAAEAS